MPEAASGEGAAFGAASPRASGPWTTPGAATARGPVSGVAAPNTPKPSVTAPPVNPIAAAIATPTAHAAFDVATTVPPSRTSPVAPDIVVAS